MEKTRREERREATAEEIKRLAWGQMRQQRAGELSLRAIARQMRMSSAAIFRYFASRDALLNAMAYDAYRSQYEALDKALLSAAGEGHWRRIMATAEAYRDWAVANPEKFALIYGTPVPDYRPDWALIVPVARQSLEIFIALVDEAARAGAITAQELTFSPTLVDQLQGIIAGRGYRVTPWVLYTALTGWSRLHGLVSLEIFGALAPLFDDMGDLFRQELALLLTQAGYRAEP